MPKVKVIEDSEVYKPTPEKEAQLKKERAEAEKQRKVGKNEKEVLANALAKDSKGEVIKTPFGEVIRESEKLQSEGKMF